LFTPPATSPPSPLSLHDALPISSAPNHVRLCAHRRACSRSLSRSASADRAPDTVMLRVCDVTDACALRRPPAPCVRVSAMWGGRSEVHTSELQSHLNLVCRLLLE